MPGLLTSQSPSGYRHKKPRNYRAEYRKFHSSTKSKKDRAGRNKARRSAIKAGKVKKGDKRDIDHVNGNPRDNSAGNKRVMLRRRNRAIK